MEGTAKKNKLISREEFRDKAEDVAIEMVDELKNNNIIEDLECLASFAKIIGRLEKALFDEKEEK